MELGSWGGACAGTTRDGLRRGGGAVERQAVDVRLSKSRGNSTCVVNDTLFIVLSHSKSVLSWKATVLQLIVTTSPALRIQGWIFTTLSKPRSCIFFDSSANVNDTLRGMSPKVHPRSLLVHLY